MADFFSVSVDYLFGRTSIKDPRPKNISDELANRIKIELDVQEIDFKSQISHLERSISASKNDLHPILQAYLEE
mgnify:CR=1 FL=1